MVSALLPAFVLGMACSVIAIVYVVVLGNESTPLNWWFKFIDWLESKVPMLAKPLGACECCFAGQLGLWSSFYFSGWAYDPLSILSHFTAAATGIVSTHFIGEAYKWKAQK